VFRDFECLILQVVSNHAVTTKNEFESLTETNILIMSLNNSGVIPVDDRHWQIISALTLEEAKHLDDQWPAEPQRSTATPVDLSCWILYQATIDQTYRKRSLNPAFALLRRESNVLPGSSKLDPVNSNVSQDGDR